MAWRRRKTVAKGPRGARSATATGNASEYRCELELQSRNYKTWRVQRRRYGSMDMFGLFDVVGVLADGTRMKFIQVKTNRVERKVKEAIAAFPMPASCDKEVWVWKSKDAKWIVHSL